MRVQSSNSPEKILGRSVSQIIYLEAFLRAGKVTFFAIIFEYSSVLIFSFQMGCFPLKRINMIVAADHTSIALVYVYLHMIYGAMKRRVPHLAIADFG